MISVIIDRQFLIWLVSRFAAILGLCLDALLGRGSSRAQISRTGGESHAYRQNYIKSSSVFTMLQPSSGLTIECLECECERPATRTSYIKSTGKAANRVRPPGILPEELSTNLLATQKRSQSFIPRRDRIQCWRAECEGLYRVSPTHQRWLGDKTTRAGTTRDCCLEDDKRSSVLLQKSTSFVSFVKAVQEVRIRRRF